MNGVTVLLWERRVALLKISALPTRTCAVNRTIWVRLHRTCSSLRLRLGKIIIKTRKHVDTIIGSQIRIQQLHYSAEIIIMIIIYCFIIQPKGLWLIIDLKLCYFFRGLLNILIFLLHYILNSVNQQHPAWGKIRGDILRIKFVFPNGIWPIFSTPKLVWKPYLEKEIKNKNLCQR